MGVIKGIIKKAFGAEEKQYTLGDAMRILKKEGNELYMPVPVEPGNPNTKYWIRKDESLIKDFPHVEINKGIKESPFQEKRASRRKGLDALFDSRRLQESGGRLDGL